MLEAFLFLDAKAVLVELLTAVSNDNADTTVISKIATPLIVPRSNDDAINNNRRDT